MPANPGDKVAWRDARLARQIPQLSRETEPAMMIVAEIIHRAMHDFLWMIAEPVINGNAWIARDLRSHLANEFIHVQVIGRHILIRLCAVWPENDAAAGMVSQNTIDIRMRAPELRLGPRLRFRKRIRSRARLNSLRSPLVRIITVDIQSLTRWSERNQVAIVVADQPFQQYMVVFAALFVDIPAAHDTRV